jgi:hypothetical protein
MGTTTLLDDSWPPLLAQGLMESLLAASVPDAFWIGGDDLCDCTFQRICEWTNPYIGRTQRYRLCCMWARIIQALGLEDCVQEIPAYYDENRHVYDTEPRAWDSEDMPMPRSLWYRQLAAQTGRTVAEMREAYQDRMDERPGPVPVGSVPKDEPTPEELRYALEQRLRHATWDVNVVLREEP